MVVVVLPMVTVVDTGAEVADGAELITGRTATKRRTNHYYYASSD